MPKTKKIAMGLAVLGAILLLVRSCSSAGKQEASKPAESQTGSRLKTGAKSRAHNDVNKLARALSMVAGQTLGLVRIRGRVLDTDSGSPIPGAEVIFTGPSGESSASCDAEGSFDLEILPGFYRSYAQAEGYVAIAPRAAERLPKQNLSDDVAMPRPKIAPLAGLFRNHLAVQLYLSGGATLIAKVVDESGAPIAGAAVAAESADRTQLLSGTDVGETDNSGEVHLRVPTGTVYLRVQHNDFAGASTASRLHLQKDESKETTIVLMRGCIIEGSVVHKNGTPALEGALEKKLGKNSYVPVGEILDGRVRYTQLHEGPVILRAWPWKNPPTNDIEFQCTKGSAWRNEVFHVAEAEPMLTGQLIDQSGAPVPLAFVDVFPLEAGGTGQQERADALGEFEFFALSPGPYQVSVYVPGKGMLVQLIDVPSTGVPLQLGGTGAITGSVEWLESGSLTLRYRCDYRGKSDNATQSDAVSMPVQTTLALVNGHSFRVDDVPACPISGSVTSADRSELFTVFVEADKDTPLLIQ